MAIFEGKEGRQGGDYLKEGEMVTKERKREREEREVRREVGRKK